MIVYLATPLTIIGNGDEHLLAGKYLLETYHALRKSKKVGFIKKARGFMLDSGAYTFMRGNADTNIDWDKYIAEYAAFVRQHNVQYFFELDIDKIVGFDNVKRLTASLNKQAGRQCLPVWHVSRGIEEWHRSTRDYSYVSLSASGNNGSSEWTRTPEGMQVMGQLNHIAQKNGCKVHALGYTKTAGLKAIKFHSVDSTAWMRGVFGFLYKFNPSHPSFFEKINRQPNERMINKKTAGHNFSEWAKFQTYALNYL